jgi:hypothetical protein
MNRRSGKTLRAILAAGIIATMVGTTQVKAAALSVDEIYANAYTATDNAMNIKTQKSINEARIAIEALIDTGADWAIGEFSKQVDQVQNPFLVKIIDAINKAEQTGKQEDINAAKASIEPELLQIWKNSYSSAIDKIQQELMKQLVDAYYNAALTDLSSDIENVEVILAEVKLASNTDIGDWAEEFTAPMRAVWKDTELDGIDNVISEIGMNINEYPNAQLYPDNNNVFTLAFYDNDKIVQGITSIKPGSFEEIYYSNNQYVFIGDTVIGEDTLGINYIYFKDDKLVKWISYEFNVNAADVAELPELTSDTVKSIKVYDENNMPNDVKSKLALYQQNAEKLLSDAEAQIS